jgi:hypothetical protein
MTAPVDSEFTAFVDKLGQFRATLDPREQRLFDTLLLAAANGPDVQGYGISAVSAKQLALAAAIALGVTAGALGPALGGTAAAAPLEQPSLNGSSGGGTRGSSSGSSSSTTSTSGGVRGTTGGTGATSGPVRGTTSGTTVSANVPGVGNVQVNLGSGSTSGQAQLPPRGESHHGTSGSTHYGGGYTGPVGAPIVTGSQPQPQPSTSDLRGQIQQLQAQINLLNSLNGANSTRNTVTTGPEAAPPPPPRPTNTGEATMVSVPPAPADPTIQELRNQQQALLEQIAALQQQVQQQQAQASQPASAEPTGSVTATSQPAVAEPTGSVTATSQPATQPSTWLPSQPGDDVRTIRVNAQIAGQNALLAEERAKKLREQSERPGLTEEEQRQAFAEYTAMDEQRRAYEAERDRLNSEANSRQGHQTGPGSTSGGASDTARENLERQQEEERLRRLRNLGEELGLGGSPAPAPSPSPSPGNWTH